MLAHYHRARSGPSCFLRTLVLAHGFLKNVPYFFWFLVFSREKSWARNVNLRKWLNVFFLTIAYVLRNGMKRHRAGPGTCYRLRIFVFFSRNRMEKKQPVTRSWARNDGERVRSLWWKREIAKCHWDSRWIFLGSIFFAETPEQRKKNMHVYGSCSNVLEHSGLTHDCDQRWSIYIHIIYV